MSVATPALYPWYTSRSVSASIVLIGPSEALPSLRDRIDAGAQVQTFTDAEALEALDHIIRHKPAVVALDRAFSDSSRGTALINRIKDDPALTGCEVRVVAHDTELSRVAVKRDQGPAVAVDEPKPALDQRGTRRAPRVRVKDGVEVTIDGNTVAAGRPVHRRRAGGVAHRAQAEPARTPGDGRPAAPPRAATDRWRGPPSRCPRACRPATGPASTSPRPTRRPSRPLRQRTRKPEARRFLTGVPHEGGVSCHGGAWTPSCGTPVWHPREEPSCGTLVWNPRVEPSCGTTVWHPREEPSCGTLNRVEPPCGTLVRHPREELLLYPALNDAVLVE